MATWVEVQRSTTRRTTPALGAAAFLAGLTANLVLALSGHQFPFEDATNNLARYTILDRAWLGGTGTVPSYIETHFTVGPYLGLDLIGAAAVHAFGPVTALHVMAAVVVCALPVGFWLLLRATGCGNLAWSLAGVLLGMGFFTVVGFANYVVGLGAAMAWLAAWWPHRATLSRARMVSLGLGLFALYLVHLSAPLIVLVVVWIDIAQTLWSVDGAARAVRGWRGMLDRLRHWLPSAHPRVQFAVGCTVLIALLGLGAGMGTAPATAHAGVATYAPVSHKLVNLASPFYVFSYGQTSITLAVYCVMAVGFLWVNRDVLTHRRRPSVFLVSALVCLVLYLVFPAGTPGTGYLDMRWLPLVFLWPFCAAESEGQSPPVALTVVMLAGCLLHDAVLGRTMRSIERGLGDYSRVLDQLPPGKRVLPLEADHDRYGLRVFPYRHYAFWYVINDGGRVPELFNADGEGGGRPHHSFLGHFVERDHLYDPGEKWGTDEFTPLDWSQIDRDYDYIIETGTDPRATRLIDAHAQERARVGTVTLFQVATRVQ